MDTVLNVSHLEKYYGGKSVVTKAVDDISLSVEKGEFVGIMGPSGSGKTTLLNCISTIDSATAGHIFINGADITRLRGEALSKFRREQLGFIFQDFNLLDTLTAYENIALGLSIVGMNAREIERRVMQVAATPGITEVLKKFPYQMSGGEKQRATAARAIVTQPALVLADEPTGALDSKSARMLMESLCGMNRQMGATVLMVTHDAFTASYADRILFIKDGKVFNEIAKGEDDRKAFFKRVIDVVTLLGGDGNVLV